MLNRVRFDSQCVAAGEVGEEGEEVDGDVDCADGVEQGRRHVLQLLARLQLWWVHVENDDVEQDCEGGEQDAESQREQQATVGPAKRKQ